MHQIPIIATLICGLLSPSPRQSTRSKIVSDLSAEQVRAIDERHDRAQEELFSDYAPQEAPDIAKPLSDPLSFIAIVVVTGVRLPVAGTSPYTIVDLHVEQFLRGASQFTELQAESRWVPPHPQDGAPRVLGGPRGTILDYFEPKVGKRYLVGYPFSDVDRGRAYIDGAIDLADHDQDRLIQDVERFLDIESVAGVSDVDPFLAALGDEVPWIRDLSAQRLVQSKACNTSPSCQQAFVSATSNLLCSRKLAERWEALKWTEPLALPMGERQSGPNGLPTISNDAVRELLASRLLDPNLWIADEAYRQLELFDFYHGNRSSRECIVIFPPLRKSIRLGAEQLKGVSIGGTFACMPAEN